MKMEDFSNWQTHWRTKTPFYHTCNYHASASQENKIQGKTIPYQFALSQVLAVEVITFVCHYFTTGKKVKQSNQNLCLYCSHLVVNKNIKQLGQCGILAALCWSEGVHLPGTCAVPGIQFQPISATDYSGTFDSHLPPSSKSDERFMAQRRN